jgi:ankyrin repeat protein
MFEAARAGDVDALREQLSRGGEVNARDEGDNASALHWAAASGSLDCVRLLVEAGADVHGHGDDHGLAVIGWATCFDEAHPHVAAYLVDQGARHHIFSAIALGLSSEVRALAPAALTQRMSHNEDHQLPLQFAVRKGRAEMVALLIELGADPLGVDAWGHTAPEYATAPGIDDPIREALAGFNGPLARRARGEAGPGALHLASKRGDADAVRTLLDGGAVPDELWSHWGAEVTALHLAAAYGHEAAARALLDAGADPLIRDSVHDSDPLGWATYFQQSALVSLLARSEREEPINVVLAFAEHDPYVSELVDAFDNRWVVGITSRGGVVRLELETPGTTWGAAVTLVEGRLDRLAFDWRSHAQCLRP